MTTSQSTQLRHSELHAEDYPTLASPGNCTAARHGTLTAAVDHGCTCPAARAIRNRNAKRSKTLRLLGRPQLVPAIGSQRRIRALMAIGWRSRDIAQRIGWVSGELDPIFRRPSIRRETAERIRAVYDALADIPGPSEQTYRRARRAGYLPPLWYDDDTIDDPNYQPLVHNGAQVEESRVDVPDPVVVERLIAGEPPLHVTKHERAEAVRILNSRDVTVSEISRRLHMSGARVTQILDGQRVLPTNETHATEVAS